MARGADAVVPIIAEGVEKSMTKLQSSRPRLKDRGRMRIYEELFIVKPDATEEEIDQFDRADETHCHQRRRHDRQGGKVGQAPAGLPRG